MRKDNLVIDLDKFYDGGLFRWTQFHGKARSFPDGHVITHLGVAEASDLQIAPGTDPVQLIWNDSCDVGIVIKSPKTDMVMVFARVHIDKGGNQTFRSITDPRVEVNIWND